ncbi:MAG: glycosyl hydrolase family 18 protein [Bacteroidales bacterium]
MNTIIKPFILILCAVFLFSYSDAQQHKSIHQEELEYHNSLGISAEEYYSVNQPAEVTKRGFDRTCNLNKVVFGWHPYWSNGLETNYDWSLLSDLSYFSYEVNPATGEPSTTHAWLTSPVVDEALANGVRVNLCVTLFSDHATLFSSETAQQTLIDSLISLVQARGAHGVNIDFEGVSTSLKPEFTAFLIDLCTQMHSEIPGSQVSVCTYAVDWGDLFDEVAIDPYIDFYTIMGYAYYYSSSAVAGPTSPLYTFGSFDYNLAKTVNYYLSQGASKEKLVLGLPYYGHEWETESNTIPSNTTSSVGSKTYKLVKNNTSGNYSNPQWEPTSFTPYYVFNDGTDWHQCFCDDENSLAYRYDFVNMMDIAGIGIWALGYDDGYTALWDLLRDKFTDCGSTPCSGTFYDMGGPDGVYYNNSDYTFTIAPTGATQVSLEFLSFDIEAGSGSACDYDYIEIFDGPDTASSSFGKFCNTTGSPGLITSSGNALTVHFHSDGATVNEGFEAVWDCVVDDAPPVTSVSADDWQADDFTAYFSDSDNDTVKHRFYQVLDRDSTEWRANGAFGFFNDNFTNATIHDDWTNFAGNWSVENEHLVQSDESSSNTNMYASVEQEAGNVYLYHFQMNISGSGNDRRAGMYFFCSDPEQSGRENSYMVYLRADHNTVQIYKYIDNSYSTGWYTTNEATVNAGQWYDVKILFNTVTGQIQVFQDDEIVASATDAEPFAAGTAISLRTGECHVQYDDVKVYKNRVDTAIVLVGDNEEVRYQNVDQNTASCRIKSIITDEAGNFSGLEGTDVNIDWTPPENIDAVNDGPGMDIDTTYTGTELSANWTVPSEPNSFIDFYEYCIGLSPGADDVVGWTNNGEDNQMTHTGLNLIPDTTYYISVRAFNASGLSTLSHTSSDGVMYVDPGSFTVADFTIQNTDVCEGDPVAFINLSQNADSSLWIITGPQNDTSTDDSPLIELEAGEYDVMLVAYGSFGNDTITQHVTINTIALPVSDFYAMDTVLELPSATAFFANASAHADSYTWDFGDGQSSADVEPWHIYDSEGIYTLSLAAHSAACGSDTLTRIDYITVIDPDGIGTLSGNSIDVYPNPVSGRVFIQSDRYKINNISVYTIHSKLCVSAQANADYAELDLSDLDEGYYMLVLDTDKGKIVKKLAVLR